MNEEAAIVATLNETIDRLGRRIDARAIDSRGEISAELLEQLAELGLFGLSLPPEHGGYGLSLGACGSVVAQLARFDRSVATTVGLHLGLGSRGLVAFGSPAQQEAFLPAMASGRHISAFAATEPDAGSDLTAVRTRVQQTQTGLRVDGSKIYVTNGALAEVFTILARSPGLGGNKRGQSLVLLRKTDEGLKIGAEEEKLGLRGSSTTSLNLDSVELPADRVLGIPGQAPEQLAHILAWGRTMMAAGCCGTGRAALDAAHRHCEVREQFGRPLKALPVVGQQLAEGEALLFAMEALVQQAAGSAEAELRTCSLAAKLLCSEGGWELADLAVQLHGGAGFIEETGVALLLRDSRVPRIFEGANDVLRVHLGMHTAGSAQPAGGVELEDEVATLGAALRTRLGARLGGAPLLLHALGSLACLAQASRSAQDRAEQDGGSHATSLAEAWQRLARLRALPLLHRLREASP